MVKTVLSVYHSGLRDWVIQRLTAIILAVYSIGLVAYVMLHPHLSFGDWQLLFSRVGMKVATLLCMAALLYHAWIGMWTVFTDYVKSAVLRSIIEALVLLGFFACFVWAWLILGGV